MIRDIRSCSLEKKFEYYDRILNRLLEGAQTTFRLGESGHLGSIRIRCQEIDILTDIASLDQYGGKIFWSFQEEER